MPLNNQETDNRRFIAIDGGGTKTACLIGDSAGRIYSIRYGGPGNIKSTPWAEVKDMLSMLILQVMADSLTEEADLVSITLGMAGGDRPEDKHRLTEFLSMMYPHQPAIVIHNDAVTALAAGTWGKAGIVLIAGTGSIACGYLPDTNHYVRIGGWGYLLGDEGSGYAMGRDALNVVMKQYDKRVAPTLLTELLLRKFNLDSPSQLITRVYEDPHPRQAIAGCSTDVFTAMKAGDQAAAFIAAHAIDELISLVTAVADRLELLYSQASSGTYGEPLPLVLSGGVFNDEIFTRQFLSHDAVKTDRFSVHPLQLPPVIGTYVLALLTSGILITEQIRMIIEQEWTLRLRKDREHE